MIMRTDVYFSKWLSEQRFYFQLSTYEAYTVYINRHILPFFSERCPNLSDITACHVKDYLLYISSSGRLDGKSGGLSPASVKKHMSVLKQALSDATAEGYLNTNPALSVRLRRFKTPYSVKHVMLTAEEAQKLINCFKGHALYPVVVLTLYYGLRRSEVLGLRWSAVNFDTNEISINHTVVKNLTIEAKDSTKTIDSNAVYQLFDDVRQMLLDMKSSSTSDYLFSWSDGRLFRPDYVTRAFKRHLKKCGLPDMRFHDLRHSTASILFDKGLSLEDVKSWLRHSDIETTSNIYLHYERSRRKLLSDTVQGLFNI